MNINQFLWAWNLFDMALLLCGFVVIFLQRRRIRELER